jgi:hypothetical protein
MTYTMEVKEDIYEVDTLFRKIVIESRVLEQDLEEFVKQKNFISSEPTETTNSDKTNDSSEESNKRKALKYNN